MKKLLSLILVGLFAMTFALASDGVIDTPVVTMDYNSSMTVDYCVYTGQNNDVPVVGVDVVVIETCQEINGLPGCTGTDIATAPNEFSAVVSAGTPVTDANGCVDVELETFDVAGTFTYVVDAQDDGESLGATESGIVQVPEFTTVAALVMVGLAGLYIYRKRD